MLALDARLQWESAKEVVLQEFPLPGYLSGGTSPLRLSACLKAASPALLRSRSLPEELSAHVLISAYLKSSLPDEGMQEFPSFDQPGAEAYKKNMFRMLGQWK